jgi:transposase-like protein
VQSEFKNLHQLLDFFKDEETCKKYYEEKRWGGNVACPHCGSLKVYRTNRGFKCGEKLCAKKFTVTVGTIFENSKISLRVWFTAMYLISTSKKGVSSLQLAEQLGVTQKTAWFVLHRIREMLKDNSSEKLEGEVQGDETFVGGRNKNRHADKKIDKSVVPFGGKTPVVG